MTGSLPKITFGIIVLNGEPFTCYNLRALYPFAHEIIVVEGASPNAAHAATPDGHSVDGTLEILRNFKALNDPDDKIRIVTAEDEGYPDGFWPGEKDEQSRAYATRATGDWLWQIDIDEFYMSGDMRRVAEMLDADPSITAITFPEIPFWGSFDYRCDGILLRLQYSKFHRVFKWGPGYQMVTHRPPTVLDTSGVDLRTIHWLSDQDMLKQGVYLYHYTQIFPKQVSNKMTYYEQWIKSTQNHLRPIKDGDRWYQETYLSLQNPYRVHTVNAWPSWLMRFDRGHPDEIEKLKADLAQGSISIPMRDTRDVEALLKSRRYQVGIALLKFRANYFTQTNRLFRDFFRSRITFRQFVSSLVAIVTGKQRLF